MDIRHIINLIESNLTPSGYRELEYVCINRSVEGSTPPQNMKKLYEALCQIDGILVYRQDFIEEADHIAVAVAAIPYYTEGVNMRTLKSIGKQHGVKDDQINTVTNYTLDNLLTGRLPHLIDVVINNGGKIQHIKGPEWSEAHQSWTGYPYEDDAVNPHDDQ